MGNFGSRLTKLGGVVAKLRGRSFAELRERGGQALAAALESMGVTSMTREPSDAALDALLDPAVVGAASPSGTQLHDHFATRQRPAFFPGVRDGASAALLNAPEWSGARHRLIAAADRVRAGTFDLLGHQGLSFGSPVDWHLDATTGRRTPGCHWSRIPYLDAARFGDHKVIWELNRHQHFVVLGRAYQVTGNEAYATAFAEQLVSWMDANPPKQGVNWASSLEMAFRAISWLWALELFRASPALTLELTRRMLKLLYLHGRHLERYLSTYFSPNTHLTGEALGLFYLGTLLPELRRSSRWQAVGWAILERELPRQILDDGVYFEQASYYQRYTVDFYLHAVVLARRNGLPVSSAMVQRLGAAVDHLSDLVRPDGTIPYIGDDDGGRLIALEERAPADVRAALAAAAVVLGRPELGAVAGETTQEVVWLLGPDGAAQARVAVRSPLPARRSTLYPVGGYAVMRDGWGSGSSHLVIDSGPLGGMHAGHAHSDALALALSVRGCPLLVDPGTYTYTGSPADRDWFRHSAMHNTVTVDGQTASEPAGPFAWRSRAHARIEEWWSGQMVDSFVGSHDGFLRLPAPAVHRRRLLFVRGEYWVVVDTVASAGAHVSTAHFHLAPGASVSPVSSNTAWIRTACADGATQVFFCALGDIDRLEWSQDWVSPAYGVRTPGVVGRAVSSRGGGHELITVLVPATAAEIPVVRELPCDGGRAVAVDRPGRHDVVLLRQGGAVRAGDITTDAGAALIRRGASSGRVDAVAVLGGGGRLTVDGETFEARSSAEFVRTAGGWSVVGDGRVVGR